MELMPDGFGYGISSVAEFEPHSIWYETSLTIVAHALRNGIRTDYHALMRSPDEVREDLARFGLDVAKLEEMDTFRILDTYTVQTGGKPQRGRAPSYYTQSADVTDWKYARRDEMGKGDFESHTKRLHADDNTAVLNQYNSETKIIDMVRSRARPYWKVLDLAIINALATGVASSTFYAQWELLCDGILDFKSEEREGRIAHLARVRKMRGKNFDSRWRRLKLSDNGEVTIAE
jgi:KaiC/GvpD/RAD55 family RecA-like ATPase